ncbi:Similar to DCP1B: mRNA-decapping enzyme 1B (Bos taurus) [Cotesia congregata]|uniref:Similar to DCP1B: mRNA-decapping enzyme 1B (Bos taurus) n=1 Tax=Cotesia congregata TaxID=51543 RepID=A0A8J2GZN0_COTCN|nr:Similar to DCP1B: mRNA-decapping enzyme 1B (Bos taurus) [Cotesia congregata]
MGDLTEIKMNMAALKRVDPYIKDILETATHVALYKFNAENNEWEKTDIEGALLNTNNLVEPVTQRLDLELQEPFLLYRNSKYNIYGIWFYDKDECIRIAAILKQLVKHSDENLKKVNTSLKNKKQVINKASDSFNNVDIFSMLSKAQENFNTSRESNGNHDINLNSDGISDDINTFSHSGTGITTGGMFDGTSQSVVDFFAKAKHQQPPGNVHVAVEKPISLSHLMSHPAAHTLEHIEKQQRSITPQSTGIPSIVPPSTVPIAVNLMKNGTPSSKTKKHACSDSGLAASSQMLQHPKSSASNDVIVAKSFHRIQSPLTGGPTNNTIINHNTPGQNYRHSIFSMDTPLDCNKVIKNEKPSAGKTLTDISALPLGFSSLDLDDKSIESEEAQVGIRGFGTNAPALMPPVMFSATSPSESTRPIIEPLTRNQLLQAFNYLLKNDSDFMMKLHDAYVKSFSEIYS